MTSLSHAPPPLNNGYCGSHIDRCANCNSHGCYNCRSVSSLGSCGSEAQHTSHCDCSAPQLGCFVDLIQTRKIAQTQVLTWRMRLKWRLENVSLKFSLVETKQNLQLSARESSHFLENILLTLMRECVILAVEIENLLSPTAVSTLSTVVFPHLMSRVDTRMSKAKAQRRIDTTVGVVFNSGRGVRLKTVSPRSEPEQPTGDAAMSVHALSISDINTTINHEPRILDVRLAEALGFSRPADIRELIERHKEALERFGSIFRMVRKNTGRGRPANEFYLTKKQALYIVTKSETENAVDLTVHIIEVFDAVSNSAIQTVKSYTRRAPSRPSHLREIEAHMKVLSAIHDDLQAMIEIVNVPSSLRTVVYPILCRMSQNACTAGDQIFTWREQASDTTQVTHWRAA
jgi:predicted ArsR family transcriptional regulator